MVVEVLFQLVFENIKIQDSYENSSERRYFLHNIVPRSAAYIVNVRVIIFQRTIHIL